MSITLPRLDYAEFRARSLPCHAIGGDFYDIIALDHCVCVAIADVSGKGVPASIVAATLQGIIHALMLTGESLPETADLINRFLCKRQVGKYATMVLLKLFPDGCVEYMNCGHIPPVLISSDATTYLEDGNLIVGIIEEATYASSKVTLNQEIASSSPPTESRKLRTDQVSRSASTASRDCRTCPTSMRS